MDYDVALQSLTEWAEARSDVRAMVMTGSGGARAAHPLSDRDLEVFTHDTDALLSDETWWSRLGDVLVVERLENGMGEATRLVYYVGGELDFTVLPSAALPERDYDRDFMVLVDKDGRAPAKPILDQGWLPPTGKEIEENISWAYAAALMCAKAIVRDEMWSAKLRDNDLKEQLLQMLEWDHRTRHGASHDTRYSGTRMNDWMDADVRADLRDCWGRFDSVDSAEALRCTLNLYRRVAQRTAASHELLGFDHDRVLKEVDAILATGDL